MPSEPPNDLSRWATGEQPSDLAYWNDHPEMVEYMIRRAKQQVLLEQTRQMGFRLALALIRMFAILVVFGIFRAKPAISRTAETSQFYFVPSSVRKSIWTLVRQLRGPHLSTWA